MASLATNTAVPSKKRKIHQESGEYSVPNYAQDMWNRLIEAFEAGNDCDMIFVVKGER